MYQYTTTTIINSNLDSNGTTAKFAGSTTNFKVTRVNTFLKANIISVSKRPYTAGVKEVTKITVPTLTTGAVVRLNVDVRLSQNTYSEYASSYLYFKKPVVVEVIATGTAATDAAAFLTQINSLKDRFGHNYFTISRNNADLTLTANDFNQRFFSVTVEELVADTNSIVQWNSVVKATATVQTAGALGFGDDDWMLRSIMVPTMENTRYFGYNKEERPVLGGNYTQFTIRYRADKDHSLDGIVSVPYSITTHVFYVKSDLVASFQAELAKLPIQIDTVGTTVTAAALASGALDLSDYPTTGYTATYTTTPAGVTGGYWTRNTAADVDAASSDANFTKVTISTAGVVTLASGHGLAANDVIGVTLYIDGTSYNLTIGVVA
jgi:hypothetical protein